MRSAGLAVADRVPWPVVDFRVDWSGGDPIAELSALYERWSPREDAYVLSALDAGRAAGLRRAGDDRL